METPKENGPNGPIYHEEDNSYTPSEASLKASAKADIQYSPSTYVQADKSGKKKVLVLCVDQKYLVCENGNRFRTGNHPIELFYVIMHLEEAGFYPVFATISGNPVVIEEWGVSDKDDALIAYRDRYEEQLSHPKVISELLSEMKADEYEAVFVPGGHGALNGLPESKDVKTALQWFIDKNKFVITICHGAAALISLSIDEKPEDFPFKGYEIALYPSSSDEAGVRAGYLPGELAWDYEAKLKELGMKVVNQVADGVTHIDGKLFSGDSPLAANRLGMIAAENLLEVLE